MTDMDAATGQPDLDSIRIALAMVRADWQDDPDAWRQLYAIADDPVAVSRELTHLCRQTLDQLAVVAGVSTAEMLHRLAGKLIPHPDMGRVTVIDLRERRPADGGRHRLR
jgi:hypothetical protein